MICSGLISFELGNHLCLNGSRQFFVGFGGDGASTDFAQCFDGEGASSRSVCLELGVCGHFLCRDAGVYSCFFYLFNWKAEAAVCLISFVCCTLWFDRSV